MSATRGIYVAIGAAALGGCSLIYSKDLDDARDPPVSDGGSLSESGVVSVREAGSDSATSVDASAGFCSTVSNAKFCEDFDGNGTVTSKLSQQGKAGTVAFDSSQFVSPPRSANVSIDTSDSCQYSKIVKAFPNVGTNRFAVHFMVHPDSPWHDNLLPFALGLDTPDQSNYCGLVFYANTVSSGAIGQGQINIQSPKTKPNDINNLTGFTPQDVWSQVDIIATPLSGGGVHFQVKITPAVGSPSNDNFDAAFCPMWTGADINVGFHCSSGKGNADYDNVWVEWN